MVVFCGKICGKICSQSSGVAYFKWPVILVLIHIKTRAGPLLPSPSPLLRHVFYIVLYCTVLYCTVLYCTVLYCTVLYCTVLYCTVLYCTVLYCTVLYCTILSSPLLFILQNFTCFESLMGRARLNPDTLLSLLRRSRDSLVFFAASSKVIFTQSCLHMAA